MSAARKKHDPILLFIFAITLLMAGTLLMMMLAQPVANGAGLAHEIYAGMNRGGDGAARLAHIGIWAFSFECLLYLLIVALCALGVAPRRRDQRLYLLLGGSFLFMLLVWFQMYFGHQRFLESGESSYFLGFPSATAWQLYGTWLSGIPLMLIYCIWFSQYVFSDADEARFNELMAQSLTAANSLGEENRLSEDTRQGLDISCSEEQEQ